MSDETPNLLNLFAVLPQDEQMRIMRSAIEQHEKRIEASRYKDEPEKYVASLLKRYQLFLQKHSFEAGQLVTWKEGLRNRKVPLDGEPAIVVEVLKKPVPQPKETSPASSYFREPLDIVLGMLDEDGDLVVFHFDSRRLKPFDGEGKKRGD